MEKYELETGSGKLARNKKRDTRYGFRDIYQAAKTEKHFNYVFWTHVLLDIILFDTCKRIFGVVLVSVALGIISTIAYIGFTVVIPKVSEPGSFLFAWHWVWGMWMLVCILFNYFMASFTSPGSPEGDPSYAAEDEASSVAYGDGGSTNSRHCKKCDYLKPKRAHHCSICRTCVLKMDHHCPVSSFIVLH